MFEYNIEKNEKGKDEMRIVVLKNITLIQLVRKFNVKYKKFFFLLKQLI